MSECRFDALDHVGEFSKLCEEHSRVPALCSVGVAEREELWKDYVALLTEELNALVPHSWVHGWRSVRHEKGRELRKKLGIEHPV